MEAGEDRTWPSPQAPTPNQARGGLDGRQSEGRQEACVICLEPVTERAIAVPCNHHTFDFICLASWLSERSTCPLCNVRVTELQYDWRSPDDFQRYRVESTTEATRPSSRGRYVRWGRRRQPRPRPALPPPPSEDEAVVKRREVYRRHLYSLHVGANRVSRHRNFTPRDFAADAQLQSRARKWIRRELRVFRYLQPTAGSVSPAPSSSSSAATTASAAATSSQETRPRRRANNAEFLLEYVVAILKTVDVKDSGGQAEGMLADFLGRDDARLFLHELGAWLRSPYVSLADWDSHVQYPEPLRRSGGGDAGSSESSAGKGRR